MRLPAYELDPGAATDGDYVLTVLGGKVTGLTPAASGGGGGGALPTDGKVSTGGNVALNSTSYVNVDTAMDLSVSATAGDRLIVFLMSAWNTETAAEGHLNAGTLVGGSIVNLIDSVGTSGVTGWWGRAVTGSGVVFSGAIRYTVVAGDIASGTVTLRLRGKTSTANTKTILRGTGFPMRFFVVNIGQ